MIDNYATHKHPNVRAWLAKRPRHPVHFTPMSASWLNMVERGSDASPSNRSAPVPSLRQTIHPTHRGRADARDFTCDS